MPLLDIDKLSIRTHATTLVDDISFSVEAGETVCLVGESGSGKTLTGLSIMGLLPPELSFAAQHILFGGQDLTQCSPRAMRHLRGRDIAMIFQEPMTALNPVMTVGKQVAEMFEIHSKITAKERKKRTYELFTKVQLKDVERMYNSYPHQLSGGQRQRVMIAMALALKPKLLIADEPTTALDVTVQKEILDLIKSLQHEMGMAVLFVTHDFGVVEHIADNVVVMQQGKLVEQGTVKHVLTAPKHPYTKRLLSAMPKLSIKAKPEIKGKKLLSTRGLTKIYTRRQGLLRKSSLKAVDNVSMAIKAGQTVGIVGESGSGKSTLARLVSRLIEADAGEVTFLGEDVRTAKPKKLRQLRKDMQMVFQDPYSSLNPRLTIGETVAEGLRAHKVMTAAKREEFVKKILQDCGLPADSYTRYPHQFSGGQRQRIGIARALALRPKLIIADEAVASLDVSIQQQILDLMNDLKTKYKLSYLFITHDLRVVSHVADELVVMQNGKVVEQGRTHSILQKPQQAYTQKLLAAIPGKH